MILRRKNIKGFTLIELIIIMGVLSVALLGLSKIFPFGMEAKQRAEDYSKIGVLAQSLTEKIKNGGYNYLEKKYPERSPGYGVGSGKFEKNPGFYWQVKWWQTDIPNLRKIKVKISSEVGQKGEPSQIEIVTYLACRE